MPVFPSKRPSNTLLCFSIHLNHVQSPERFYLFPQKTGNLKEKTKFQISPPKKKEKQFFQGSILISTEALPPNSILLRHSPVEGSRCTVPSKRLHFLLGKASTRKGVGQNSGRCVLLRLLLKNMVLHEKFRGHPPHTKFKRGS